MAFIYKFIMIEDVWKSTFFKGLTRYARAIFLILVQLIFGAQKFISLFVWNYGGCPMHCRMSTSISDLYSLDANSISPSCDNQNCLQTLSDGLWGKNCPWLTTIVLEEGKVNCSLASLMLELSMQDVLCLLVEFHNPLYCQFLGAYIPISTS